MLLLVALYILPKYHLLTAKYRDAEGNHPDYLDYHFGDENHCIFLSLVLML
jgi:hypothetical protein